MANSLIDAIKAQLPKLPSLFGQLLLFVLMLGVFSLALDSWRGRHIAAAALPDEDVLALNGDVNLAQFAQQSLGVIYVWASWCGPCKATTPAIGRLSEDYPVVTVALRSGDDAAVVADAPAQLKNSLLINDNEGHLAEQLGVSVTPSILFVKEGKVVAYTSGISSYWGLWLRAKWLTYR